MQLYRIALVWDWTLKFRVKILAQCLASIPSIPIIKNLVKALTTWPVNELIPCLDTECTRYVRKDNPEDKPHFNMKRPPHKATLHWALLKIREELLLILYNSWKNTLISRPIPELLNPANQRPAQSIADLCWL